MFNNKVLRSLIIDDVNYKTNDKKLFKSILDSSKKKKRIIR